MKSQTEMKCVNSETGHTRERRRAERIGCSVRKLFLSDIEKEREALSASSVQRQRSVRTATAVVGVEHRITEKKLCNKYLRARQREHLCVSRTQEWCDNTVVVVVVVVVPGRMDDYPQRNFINNSTIDCNVGQA